MREELKPCPFCGSEAGMITAESVNGGYLFGIMCNDCRSRGDVYDTEAEAITAWNRRAYEPPEGATLVDALGEVLDCELIAIEHEMARRYKEIVRCKDCKGYRAGEPCGWCNTHMTAIPRKDGFCAWGVPADSVGEIPNRGLNDGRSDG